MVGQNELHHVRRLTGIPERSDAVRTDRIRRRRARLERNTGVPAKAEFALDDCDILRGEGGIHVSGLDRSLPGEGSSQVQGGSPRILIKRRFRVARLGQAVRDRPR